MYNSLVTAIEKQAQACAALGAPFSAGLLEHARRDIVAGGIVSRLLAGWNALPVERLISDAVALRLLASLHHLVLSGCAPGLAALYPPAGNDPESAWAVGAVALAENAELVTAMLTHEPQTNEVRRSACLLGGFLTIAEETRLPLRCFEMGASAGLNSLWDKFHYRIGDKPWGDPASPVVLPCRWEGYAPSLHVVPFVAERHACDRRPVDLGQPDDVTRLLAYCWAEQRERMGRLRAVIRRAQANPVPIYAEQAARFVQRAGPEKDHATVLFHSIVWQYIPPAEQAEITATLRNHGAQARRDAPFYWLRMELNAADRRYEVKLWDGQADEERLLAIVHPHGEFASWQ